MILQKDIDSYPTPLTRDTIIANTDDEAYAIAEKHLLLSYRDEYGRGKWKHPLIGNQDKTPTNDLDAISKDRFLIGCPAKVVESITKYIDIFKVDHLIFRLYFPGISHNFILKELKLISQEVIPAIIR